MSPAKIVKADPLNPPDELIKEAAGILRVGGLVIIPTDTVYGVAAAAGDQKAIDKFVGGRRYIGAELFDFILLRDKQDKGLILGAVFYPV